jgi:hypothetical protein
VFHLARQQKLCKAKRHKSALVAQRLRVSAPVGLRAIRYLRATVAQMAFNGVPFTNPSPSQFQSRWSSGEWLTKKAMGT